MTARELRLRERIDQLRDRIDEVVGERDAARAELREVREDIRVARGVAAGAGAKRDESAHSWLAEYDRRAAARKERKREKTAYREAQDFLARRRESAA